jgi:hypothetical protein
VTPSHPQKPIEAFHDPKTPSGSLEMPNLKERRARRSISDSLLIVCAMVLDDKKMRRLVRRMRVHCGEREQGVPAGAICQRQCILTIPSLYDGLEGEESLLADLRSVADGLFNGVG